MTSKKSYPFYTALSRETLLIQLLLIVVFATCLWFFDWSFFGQNNYDNNTYANTASLVLEESGTRRIFSGEVAGDMTMVDALNAASLAGNFSLDYSLSLTGDVIVREIDGFNVKDSSVSFYLDGNKIEMANLARVLIKEGNLIEIHIK